MEQTGLLYSEFITQYNFELKKYLTSSGMPFNQAKALMLIGVFGEEDLSQKELAELCGIDTPAMSRVIDKLSEEGYIIREKQTVDSRRVNLELTDKGREKSSAIIDMYNDYNAEFLSPLSKAERRQLSEILSKITHKSELVRRLKSKK